MTRNSIHTQLRNRLESFATDLADLITQAAIEAVERGLSEPAGPLPLPATRPSKPARSVASGELAAVPRRAPTSAVTSAPLTLDAYERMALQRALAESSGNMLAAAKLLGMSKSAIYRRVRALGVSGAGRRLEHPTDPLATAHLPLSVDAYEKAAITRAIEESAGDKLAAAKLLGISRSAIYRKAAQHGLS